ncbi:MAG: CBS domain-containing protein [Ornithinimicrobium sp.]
MLVRDVMTSPAYYLHSGTSFEGVITLLVDAKISSVPILDADDQVVGIVTEADVLRAGLQPDNRATLIPRSAPASPWPETVDEVMTATPQTVRPTSDVADVAHLMGVRGWKSIPVVERDALVGVVSRSDILRTLHTSDRQILSTVTAALAGLGHHGWTVLVSLGIVSIAGPSDPREEELARTAATGSPGVRRVIIRPSTG